MAASTEALPDASGPWEGGWHRFAQRLPSPNHGPRPAPGNPVDLIVLHSISLPPGEFGGTAVQQLFTNRLDPQAHPYYQNLRGLQVSAHFFITRSGQPQQFVDCDRRAWHAGQSSYRGRGQCNDDSIGIELEGLEGLRFEPAQYRTLVMLCRDIALRYPIAHIAGHQHIAPGRKQDPGPGFDWAQLQRALGWPRHCFPKD
ncbi:1,6-anhydro-N-acetylmuramyl-L-alanine amidase AmpD [Verminephrobacter eiseniae]|uniref:1,6-anhydro-N-acetylmuramyl-L-alanine amidase AmpD n=1 Tax=Verminephrobacter eiseniae TaxID=364317 RepID=UPI002237309C|nr:1,6-anhydro-N-acetylmuramyl-L-alanine amidase AmpD [Verminephrobacter eiseniae]MCW5236259.1 1,6-anhydro-N-acetylmuramyl-L-alanine amidase AmpD [Verminephrobacter eiseniae]